MKLVGTSCIETEACCTIHSRTVCTGTNITRKCGAPPALCAFLIDTTGLKLLTTPSSVNNSNNVLHCRAAFVESLHLRQRNSLSSWPASKGCTYFKLSMVINYASIWVTAHVLASSNVPSHFAYFQVHVQFSPDG
jgi:hypothetical protein